MMETKINITEEKLRTSEMVEVIVETEAQAGMSGINISGGGREGLFISEILKDSPAAKNLSFQEGDQIISARVYFENIKYEDALTILQYAERYKVSYCLKRTVPSSDVTLTPVSSTVELKGPKAKMPKMTVKSLTAVKKKKKKAPSQAKDSEVSVEAVKGSELSAASMDIPPVDVEFSFPKLSKFLKTRGAAEGAEVEEQKGLKMKFPRLRAKDAGAEAEVKDKSSTKFGISVPKMKKHKVDVAVSKPEIGVSVPKIAAEAKEESIFKAPQVELDIPLPAIKADRTEISESVKMPAIKIPDVTIKGPTTGMDVEAPEAKLTIPKLPKIDLCTPKIDIEQDLAIQVDGRSKAEMKIPSVEIAAPKLDVDFSLPKVEGAVEIKPPETTGEGFQIKLPKFSMSSKATEAERKAYEEKMKIPSITTPQVGVSIPKGKIEGDSPDGLKRSAIKMPSLEISAPKIDVEAIVPKLETGDIAVEKVDVPDVTLKMPKISAPLIGVKVKDAYAARAQKIDVRLEKPELESAGDISLKMSKISLPKVGLTSEEHEFKLEEITTQGADEDFKVKGPKIKLPTFGILTSKDKTEIDAREREKIEAEGKLKFPSIKMPSVDISLPNVPDIEPGKLEVIAPTAKVDIKTPHLESPELGLKMPKISLSKLDISTKLSKPDESPPKPGIPMTSPTAKVDIKAPQLESPDLSFKMPKISLPKVGLMSEEQEVKFEEITTKGAEDEFKLKGPKIKLPTFGILTSKDKTETETREREHMEAEGKLKFPSIKMPSVDISLPKVPDIEPGKLEVKAPTAKVDIKTPHLESPELGLKMPKISLPKLDISTKLSKPDESPPKTRIQMTKSETKIKGDVTIKEEKHMIPELDISIPTIKAGDFGITSLKSDAGISIEKPKIAMKSDAIAFDGKMGDTKVVLPSGKLPSLEIVAPKMKTDTFEIVSEEVDTRFQMPKFNLPNLSDVAKDMAVELNVPKITGDLPDIALERKEPALEIEDKGVKISLPKVELGLGKVTEQEFGAGGHKEKVDVQLPKVKLEKPDVGGAEAKIKLPSVKLPSVEITTPSIPDVDIDASVPKVSMELSSKEDSSIDISSEADVKWKAPRFSLRKLGISSPKGKKGGEAEKSEAEGEISVKGPKIKMPKFGMVFPKTKHDVEGDIDKKASKMKVESPKGQADVSTNGKFNLPSIELPTVDISAPKLEVDIAVPKVEVSEITGKPSEIDIDIPEVKLNLPKFSLPKFGKGKGNGEESEKLKAEGKISPSKITKTTSAESREGSVEMKGKGKELKMKMPAIKMPSFGISKKDVDASEAKVELSMSEAKTKKVKATTLETEVKQPQEGDGKGYFIKMPTFKMSPPKIKTPKDDITLQGSEENIQLPDLKVPQVSLPSLGLKSDKKDEAVGSKTDAKMAVKLESTEVNVSDILKMPSLEISAPTDVPELQISVPCVKPDICTSLQKTEVDVTDVDILKYEGDLKIPQIPSLGVSVPGLELDIGLPKASVDSSKERETSVSWEKTAGKILTPKVEWSKYGEPEAKVDTSHKGSKIKLPHIDISLPKVTLDEEDIPFIEGETKSVETSLTEARFSLPSVELPKMSTPKIKAPDLELDIGMSKDDIRSKDFSKAELRVSEGEQHDLNLKMPKIKLPKFGASSASAEEDSAKLHAKASKQGDFSDSGIMGFKIKMPKLQVGSPKVKVDVEKVGDQKVSLKSDKEVSHHEESENGQFFKIKMPTFGVSTDSTDAATEPLHSSEEGAGLKIKIPDISLPEVGFSVGEGERVKPSEVSQHSTVDRLKATTSSSIEDLEIDLGLKMPKIKMPTIGRRTDDEMEISLAEESEAKKSLLKMPDVEISAPKIKAHGEYDVDSAKLDKQKSDSMKKITKSNVVTDEDDPDKKYKVTLPKFAVSLPKVSGDLELSTPKLNLDAKDSEIILGSDEEHEAKKVKKTFSLGKSKDKDSSLEVEGPDMKIKLPKIKMKPNFGRSRGKGKGSEVNGEFETDADADVSADGTGKSIKIKFPKLGFASSKSGELSVNGTSSGHVNGENAESARKLKLPKLEFSSLYKGKEIDSEMNMKLVKKETEAESSVSEKSKSSKKAFSGFKKKDKGEHTATTEHRVEGDAKSGKGRISLGFLSNKSKGEYTVDHSSIEKETDLSIDKSTKYKIPKLSLGTKSETEVDSSVEMQKHTEEGSLEGFKITLPQVSFTTHQEEQITKEEETTLGFIKVTTTKQITTETVTEKTLAI
ncbi:periaxin [Gastrophryne carolinensis]